mgnify:CR=1 FL=1
MGFYDRMRIDQKKLDRINERIPLVMGKMLQFQRVKLELLKRMKGQNQSIDAQKDNLKRFIKVLDREERFNRRIFGYVRNMKSSEKDIKKRLAHEPWVEKEEIIDHLSILLDLLNYTVFHFKTYGSNIKKERKIAQRLLDQPKRIYIIWKYHPENDWEKLDNTSEYVTGGLAIIIDAYEERCEERIQEFMAKWGKVRIVKKLKYTLLPLVVVSTTLTTILMHVYEDYMVTKFKLWKDYEEFKGGIVVSVRKKERQPAKLGKI